MTTAPPAVADNVVALPRPPRASGDAVERRAGAVAPLVVAIVAIAALDGGLYDFSSWGLLALAMLVVLAGMLIAGRVGKFGALTPALIAIVGLAGWASASMVWADSADRAWTESSRLVLYAALLAICVAAMRERRDAQRSLTIVGGVIAAAALWATVALLRGDPGAFLDHRLDSPIGYINGAAGLFLMGLWPLVSLAERASKPLVAGVAMALAVVEANLLVLTQSRAIVPAVLITTAVLLALFPGRVARLWTLLLVGAGTAAASHWVLAIYADRVPGMPRQVPDELASAAALAALAAALACGLISGTITFARSRFDTPPARRAARVGAVAAVAIVGVVALIGAGDPIERVRHEWRAFTTLQVEERSSRFTGAGGFRYDLWRVAVDDLRHEPLHGVGAGSYGLSYYQQRRQDEPVRQPHSLPLQILAELGIVGGLLMALAVAGSIAAVVRSRRANVAAAVAGVGIAVSWATQTSLDWLYNLPGLTCIAIVGLVAAVAPAAPPAPAPDDGPAPGRRGRLLLIGAATLIALAAASLGRQYSASVYADRATDALASSPTVALQRSATALALNPYAVDVHYLRGAAFARLDDYARSRDALMQAADREPLNFVPWALMGDLAARRNDLSAARSAYRRAVARNPRDAALRELAAHPERALR